MSMTHLPAPRARVGQASGTRMLFLAADGRNVPVAGTSHRGALWLHWQGTYQHCPVCLVSRVGLADTKRLAVPELTAGGA